MRRILAYGLAILAITTGLIVGALNAQPIELDLIWIQLTWPLGLVFILAFVFGLLIGISGLWLLRLVPARLEIKRLKKASQKVTGSDTSLTPGPTQRS